MEKNGIDYEVVDEKPWEDEGTTGSNAEAKDEEAKATDKFVVVVVVAVIIAFIISIVSLLI